MADAGTIWYEALSSAGKNIGGAIGEVSHRNQQFDQLLSAADELSKVGIDPTSGQLAPITVGEGGGEGKNKIDPIINPQFLQGIRTKAYGERMKSQGALEALLKMGTNLAYHGALARMKTNAIPPRTAIFDPQGLQIGERSPTGAAHFYPKWVSHGDPAKKTELEKRVAKYGLEPGDLQQIDQDSLVLLDKTGDPLTHGGGGAPKTAFHEGFPWYGSVVTPGTGKGQDVTSQAQYISGVAGGKTFKIPFKEWAPIINMVQGGQADQATQAKGANTIPVVNTPAEAMKLPPGTLFYRAKDQKLLRVPGSKSPAQSSDTQSSDTEDNGGAESD